MLFKVSVWLNCYQICQKNHWILSTHSSTSKNVSWPHLSWPTLYVICQYWITQVSNSNAAIDWHF